MTLWNDFVKEYASDYNLSYGCALSKKKTSKAYHDYKYGGEKFGVRRDNPPQKNNASKIKKVSTKKKSKLKNIDISQFV